MTTVDVTTKSVPELQKLWMDSRVQLTGIKYILIVPKPGFPQILASVIVYKFGNAKFPKADRIPHSFLSKKMLEEYQEENSFWELLRRGFLTIGLNHGPLVDEKMCEATMIAQVLRAEKKRILESLLFISQHAHSRKSMPVNTSSSLGIRQFNDAVADFNPINLVHSMNKLVGEEDFEKMGENLSLIQGVCSAIIDARDHSIGFTIKDEITINGETIVVVRSNNHSSRRIKEIWISLEKKNKRPSLLVLHDEKNRFAICNNGLRKKSIAKMVQFLRSVIMSSRKHSSVTMKELLSYGTVSQVPELEYVKHQENLFSSNAHPGIYGKVINISTIVEAFKFAYPDGFENEDTIPNNSNGAYARTSTENVV